MTDSPVTTIDFNFAENTGKMLKINDIVTEQIPTVPVTNIQPKITKGILKPPAPEFTTKPTLPPKPAPSIVQLEKPQMMTKPLNPVPQTQIVKNIQPTQSVIASNVGMSIAENMNATTQNQQITAPTVPVVPAIATAATLTNYYSVFGMQLSKSTIYIVIIFILLIGLYYAYTRYYKTNNKNKKNKKREQEVTYEEQTNMELNNPETSQDK